MSEVEIWDLKGALVHRLVPETALEETRLDLRGFPKGTYLVHIKMDGHQDVVRKIVIQ